VEIGEPVIQKETKTIGVTIKSDVNKDAIPRHDENKDAVNPKAQGPRETKRPNSNSAEYRWVGV